MAVTLVLVHPSIRVASRSTHAIHPLWKRSAPCDRTPVGHSRRTRVPADPSMHPTDPVTCRCGFWTLSAAPSTTWACDKLNRYKTPLHQGDASYPRQAVWHRINKQPRLGQALDLIVRRPCLGHQSARGLTCLGMEGGTRRRRDSRGGMDLLVCNPSCKTYIAGAAKLPAKEKCRTYKDNIQPAC